MSTYCDDCLTVAYDYVGAGIELQLEFMRSMDLASLEDHTCERIETDGESECDCNAHRR